MIKSLCLIMIALILAPFAQAESGNYISLLGQNIVVGKSVQILKVTLNAAVINSSALGNPDFNSGIAPDAAYVQDKTAMKYFAADVIRSGGIASRINQAVKNPNVPGSYRYETLSIAPSGDLNSYTTCDVDPSAPANSVCKTATAAVCNDFEKNKITEMLIVNPNTGKNQLQNDAKFCQDFKDKMESLDNIVAGSSANAELNSNIAAMNASHVVHGTDVSVAKYLGLTIPGKKVTATTIPNVSYVKFINGLANIAQLCDSVKKYGFKFQAGAATAPAPTTTSTAIDFGAH